MNNVKASELTAETVTDEQIDRVTELMDCLVAVARDAGSAQARLSRAEAERQWAPSSKVIETQRALRAARSAASRAEATLARTRKLFAAAINARNAAVPR